MGKRLSDRYRLKRERGNQLFLSVLLFGVLSTISAVGWAQGTVPKLLSNVGHSIGYVCQGAATALLPEEGQFQLPEARWPKIGMPEVALSLPEVSIPPLSVPKIQLPDLKMTGSNSNPSVGSPLLSSAEGIHLPQLSHGQWSPSFSFWNNHAQAIPSVGLSGVTPLYSGFNPAQVISDVSPEFNRNPSVKLSPIFTETEDEALKTKLENLFAQYPSHFVPHLYYYNLQDHSYVNVDGYAPVAAASLIKLPVLVSFLDRIDHGDYGLDTPLLYLDHHRAWGSGVLQYQASNQLLPARDVATSMIQISDNTSTNMLLSSLGGMVETNAYWQGMGMKNTQIHNVLPDLEGTNVTSPYELATLLYNLDQGFILTRETRQTAIDIMLGTHNRRLLPARLPKEVQIAHKTGDIGTLLGDAGIVYLPDGRKYIVAVQMERPFNDYTARDIIQQASAIIYEHQMATSEFVQKNTQWDTQRTQTHGVADAHLGMGLQRS